VQLNRRTGWLKGVRRLPSPNCDERPPASDIDLLVIHGISLPPGCYGGGEVDQLFLNELDCRADPYFGKLEGLKLSSHVLIRRDGSLTQYVSFLQRAWHAGQSNFRGRECCNDFSIGVELEGLDSEPYESAQYERLAELTGVLIRTWPGITMDRIVGHSDIAPGRKTDPGPAFDWRRFRNNVAQRDELR
jgi:AmpD protein